MKTLAKPSSWSSTAALCGLFGIFLLSACSGGGSNNDRSANEFALMSVALESNHAEFYVGRPIRLETILEASTADHDITVSYYLIDAADVANLVEQPRQFWLGSDLWETVHAGRNLRTCSLVVPIRDQASIGSTGLPLTPGFYYLTAYIDEAESRRDDDRSNNGSAVRSLLVDVKISPLPDIVIHDIDGIDDDIVPLHDDEGDDNLPEPGFDDHPNDHFDATVVISAVGVTSVSNVKITAYVELSGNGLGPAQDLRPLLIWNSDLDPVTGIDSGHYDHDLTLPALEPGVETSFHLDFHIPPATRAALDQRIANLADFAYEVVVMADEDDLIVEFEDSIPDIGRDDNNIISDDVIVIPDPPAVPTAGVVYGHGYHKDWANENFGVGIAMDAEARFDEDGATDTLRFRVPVTIFGLRFDFMGVSIDARHDPAETADSFMAARGEFFGTTLWTLQEEHGFSKELSPFEDHEFFEKHTTFWVGPFPVTVTGILSAGIKVGIGCGIDDQFYLEVKPHIIGLEAEIRAGLGRGFEAGVGGSLILVDDIITIRTDCGMALINNGSQLQAQLGFSVTNELRGPNGELFVYVTWPRLGWSWKRGVYFKKPGIKKFSLVEWVPFSEKDILFKKVSPITTVDLN